MSKSLNNPYEQQSSSHNFTMGNNGNYQQFGNPYENNGYYSTVVTPIQSVNPQTYSSPTYDNNAAALPRSNTCRHISQLLVPIFGTALVFILFFGFPRGDWSEYVGDAALIAPMLWLLSLFYFPIFVIIFAIQMCVRHRTWVKSRFVIPSQYRSSESYSSGCSRVAHIISLSVQVLFATLYTVVNLLGAPELFEENPSHIAEIVIGLILIFPLWMMVILQSNLVCCGNHRK